MEKRDGRAFPKRPVFGSDGDLLNGNVGSTPAARQTGSECSHPDRRAIDASDGRFCQEDVYLRAVDWIAREAKNGEGNGYKAIREAVTEDPDFAVAIYNTSWRLLGLPKGHAMDFAEKAVQTFAPEALDYIDKSHKLDALAKRYPAFIAQVRSSYFSPFELAKVRTYVEMPS